MSQTEDGGGMNVFMMVVHALAFGLYLLSIAGNGIIFALYLFLSQKYLHTNPSNPALIKITSIYADWQTVVCWVNFIDVILLCVIFCQLSTPEPQEEEEEEEEEDPEEIRRTLATMAELNHEAEMQAKIWNQFMNSSSMDRSRKVSVAHGKFTRSD
jgi:hypothetical protein